MNKVPVPAPVTRQRAPAPNLSTASNGPSDTGADERHASQLCTFRPAHRCPITAKDPSRPRPAPADGAGDPVVASHGSATQRRSGAAANEFLSQRSTTTGAPTQTSFKKSRTRHRPTAQSILTELAKS